ncbi:MAG: hypothetical protein LBT49_02785 [Prevotellaceae bacterium]|jgi:hypothetical protein|nr:hypothetical protein [Prevotellaceae bacterium]
MNETEKINLQQEISSLKKQHAGQAKQQEFLLEQLNKICDLIKELTEILIIETKQNIACLQNKNIKLNLKG